MQRTVSTAVGDIAYELTKKRVKMVICGYIRMAQCMYLSRSARRLPLRMNWCGSALNGLSVPASALLLVSRTYPLMVVRSGCLGNAAFFGWHQGMPRIWNAAAIGFAVRCLIRRTPPRWPPCFVALWSRDTVRYLKLRSTGC